MVYTKGKWVLADEDDDIVHTDFGRSAFGVMINGIVYMRVKSFMHNIPGWQGGRQVHKH